VTVLSYGPATDFLNGAALTAGNYVDVIANQDFTVTSATSAIEIAVRLSVNITAALASNLAARAVIDSGGTPITVNMDGGFANAGAFDNVGGAAFWTGGLAAGTHTIKLQVAATQNATAYCRAASAAGYEFAEIQVVECSR
jgi:hypothetical protein